MNTFNEFIIFSTSRVEDIELSSKDRQYQLGQRILDDLNLPYMKVLGKFNNEYQASLLVTIKNRDEFNTIENIAFSQFRQDSILYVDSNRLASLHYQDGDCKFLGKFKPATKLELAYKDYTLNPNTGIYYTCS